MRSLPAFFQSSNPARGAETEVVSFWTLVLRKRFLLRRLHVRSYQDILLQASRNTNVATLEKGAPNTLREGGGCFASADTLKVSGGRVVVSSSNTWREHGSRFVLASVDTSRESGGKRGGEQV